MNRRPIEERQQFIVAYAGLFLFMSLLSGTILSLFFTVPAFLIISSLVATGRYERRAISAKTEEDRHRERNRLFYSGCHNLAARKIILGY